MGFTYPPPANWASATFLNEMVAAINERRDALGWEPIGNVSAGDDIQQALLYAEWQVYLEGMAVQFVDHGDHGGNWGGQDAIPRFDLASWRAAAGLDADGFRRTAVEPSDPAFEGFEHGHVQAGDILGPWIFEDLQSGLDILRWTLEDGLEPSANGQNTHMSAEGYATTPGDYAGAEAAAEANKQYSQDAGGEWVATVGDVLALPYAALASKSGYWNPEVVGDSSYTWDLYMTAYGNVAVHGLTTDGKLSRVATGVSETESVQVGNTAPIAWPDPPPGDNACRVTGSVAVLKWQFAYTL